VLFVIEQGRGFFFILEKSRRSIRESRSSGYRRLARATAIGGSIGGRRWSRGRQEIADVYRGARSRDRADRGID